MSQLFSEDTKVYLKAASEIAPDAVGLITVGSEMLSLFIPGACGVQQCGLLRPPKICAAGVHEFALGLELKPTPV